MRTPSPAALLLAAAIFAPACEKSPAETVPEPAPATKTPPVAKGGEGAPRTAPREMPKFPPLTEEGARRVLRGQLDRLSGDDVSRQALVYLAGLGDRSGVNPAHEKLLARKEGAFEDLSAAAVGAEALLAYGEKDGAATALAVAKQYFEEEEDPDEFLVHALSRVQGADLGAAADALLKIAAFEDEEIAVLAVDALATNAVPAARDAFLRIAADAKLGGRMRAAAVAGLLRVGDAKARELADQLVAEATKPDNTDDPLAEDVLAGFGVEGAVEASPYVTKTLDLVIAADDFAMMEAPEAVTALARIHAKSGGADVIPWLRQLATRDDGFHEDEASLALWALGDDAAAANVAEQLKAAVAAWSAPTDTGPAVEILDIAARRGAAAKPPLREIVESAAQVDATRGQGKGTDFNLRALNLAAAHAFLKSTAK